MGIAATGIAMTVVFVGHVSSLTLVNVYDKQRNGLFRLVNALYRKLFVKSEAAFFHASWKEDGGNVLVNSQGIEDVILSEMAINK